MAKIITTFRCPKGHETVVTRTGWGNVYVKNSPLLLFGKHYCQSCIVEHLNKLGIEVEGYGKP